MKELVEFIAKSLVEQPEEVTVSVEESEIETTYKIKVAEEDMGRIIGKQGRIIKSIRTVTKAAAIKGGTRVQVEIDE